MQLTATVTFTALLVGMASLSQPVSASCSTPEWGQCGKGDGSLSCCPTGFYCQPWDPSNFQCQRQPTKCPAQYTNVDFVGNDIATIFSIQPEECCTRCAQTKGCQAYTFVNYRAGPPACYLKRLAGKQNKLVGAVSGVLSGGDAPRDDDDDDDDGNKTPTPPTPPPNGCATNPWGKCGDEKKAFCCPNGQYCQPWNPGFYQCVLTPPQCPTQFTDTDFPGNDIGKARAGTGEECCAACMRNSKCKAYTFVNFNNDGPQCFLKSGAGNGKGVSKVGAVSGRR